MTWEPDPVSVLFETGARRLLERAYANRGKWQGTRIADPSPRTAATLAGMGMNWRGRDNAVTASGKKLDAKDRWCRGFVRAVYRVNRPLHGGRGGPVQIELGRRLPVRGIIPSGRAVRVRITRGGQVRDRAVERKRDPDRIYADDGSPAGRFSGGSLAAQRDWQ